MAVAPGISVGPVAVGGSSRPAPSGYIAVAMGNTPGGPGVGGPTPINIGSTSGTAGSGAPKLAAIAPTAHAGTGGCDGCGGFGSKGPAPVRASTTGAKGGDNPFAVTPTFHIGGPGGTHGTDGKLDNNYTANPTKDGRDGKPIIATNGAPVDVDFSGYMASLQRLIKKHWFPPKDSASRRLSVTFKITRDGHMSNLQLNHSTGIQIADNAGLRAVEDAAPYFRPLPEGAPENVDIEFTFDYNVLTY
jgi:TonB family protein